MSVKRKIPANTEVYCAWGNCVHWLEPDGSIGAGFGPLLCPCDHLPGWKSKWPAGQPKPGWRGRAKGRNGSRVQRSRKRHERVITILTPDGVAVQVDRRMYEMVGKMEKEPEE